MKKHVLFILSLLLTVSFMHGQTLQESFEGSTFPPEGWEQTTSNFSLGTYSSSAHHGSQYAYIGSGIDTLITPKLSVNDGDYFSLQAKSGSGLLQVLISSDKSSWTVLDTLATGWSYQNYTLSLGSAEAGEKYIALAADAGSYNSVYVDSINGPSIYVPAVDAGIASVDQPSATFATGSNDVIVTLKNYGTDDLTSVDIEWSIDGNAQTTYNWTGTLSQGATEEVTLGSYNFNVEQEYSISVNTTQPNGTSDGNADNNTASATVSAVAPIVAPHVQDFDGVSIPNVPDGWNTITSNNYVTCETISDAPYSSPNEVKMNNSFYTSEDIILVSKLVDNYNNKVLKFYARGDGQLAVGTMSDNSDASTFEPIDTMNVSSGYSSHQVDFSSYSGGDGYIAIKHANEASSQTIYIDDFTWTEKKPNDAAISSIDQPSGIFDAGQKDVLVTLKNNGTSELTEAAIEWEVDGAAQTTKSWTGSLGTNATEQVNLGSYDFSDGGNFTITANVTQPNGVSDENNLNDTVSTSVYANAPLTTPHTEDFDGVSAPSIPIGWNKIVNSSSGSATVESSSSLSHTGSNSVKFYNAGDDASGLYLVSPPIESFSGNHLKVHLGGVNGGSFSIGTMSDPSDASTFEEFDNVTINYEFEKYVIDFYNYSGSDKYIAIKHGNAGTYQSVYADHFVWEETPVLSPESSEFGYLSADDTSETRDFVVTNTGSSNMQINSNDITITGTNSSEFTVNVTSDIDLATGETATIPVRFAPASAGKKQAKLSFTTSKATYQADLSGKALPENSLIEYFEGASFPPMGWDKPANLNWQQKENASIEGSYSAYHSGDAYDILSTPKLDIREGDSLIFQARNSVSGGGSLSIMISEDGENWTKLKDISVTDTESQYKVGLTASEAGQKYLGFKAYKYIYLDCVIGPRMLSISHDASLSDIMLDGSSMDNFHPDTLSYEKMLASSVTSAPTVSVTTSDDNATVDIQQASTLPGFAFITVTAEDNVTEQQYEVYFDKASAADSTLKDLKVDGSTVDGFRKDSVYYVVELPYGTSDVPVVEAEPTDTSADVTINEPSEVPGNTTVDVVSADGSHSETYTVEFTTRPGKTITFTITDSLTGNPVENAVITLDNSRDLMTDADGNASLDTSNATYDYTVSKNEYHEHNGTVIVDGSDMNENISLTPKFYTVTFEITDADGALENALISMGGQEISTNSRGNATIDTVSGIYDYTVSMDGYQDTSGTVEVAGSSVTEALTMKEKKYTVTFHVTDENSNPLEGADVNIQSASLTTDSDGKTSIELTDGNYDYTVTMDDYEDADGSVTISGSSITENISMKEMVTSISLSTAENVSIYPNPSGGSFNVEVENAGGFASIFSLTGELIVRKKISRNTAQFNISNSSDGIYLIKISNMNGSFTKKLIKK